MPYSLIHCKIIRTGIHKGNPLVPFVESGYAVLLKTLFYIPSARTGRFGNPIGRVSDGSFPYFCTDRNRVPARHERKKTLFLKKRKTDCHAPFGARNDRTVVNRTFYGGCNDRIVSIVLICKLRIIKLCIKAVLFKQLLVRALLSHPAAVHNKYAVGVAYC